MRRPDDLLQVLSVPTRLDLSIRGMERVGGKTNRPDEIAGARDRRCGRKRKEDLWLATTGRLPTARPVLLRHGSTVLGGQKNA